MKTDKTAPRQTENIQQNGNNKFVPTIITLNPNGLNSP